ncbi:MAG: HAD-IC family P-type ATPase [Bacilli bacterium]|nr:HAD-IC family P-type ATPase [Bacilli bacterium]
MAQNKSALIEKKIETAEKYSTDIENGLTSQQVLSRRHQKLTNYNKKEKQSYLKTVIKNVFTVLNFILLSCGLIILYLGLYKRLFFLMAITLNTIINLFRDLKLQKILNALSLTRQNNIANVIRDGKIQSIFFKDIVLSDIVVLYADKVVPSDSKIVDGSVYVDESFLTGEKRYVLKQKGNFLFSESIVISGRCKAEVIKVGLANYIYKLQQEISFFSRPKNNIFSTIAKYIKITSFIIFFIVFVEVLIMLLKHIVCVNILDAIISSLLSMVSTGVFLLFSVTLILWSIKLIKNNILSNETFAIENLVSSNVFCLDKTGTITNNDMDFQEVVPITTFDRDFLEDILGCFANLNNEKANLTIEALRKKINKKNDLLAKEYINFDSKLKYSAILVNDYVYVLGAVDFVHTVNNDEIKEKVSFYENEGFRTLTLSYSKKVSNEKVLPNDLETIGIVLFAETVNDNIETTMHFLLKNNININIISGDSEIYLNRILQKIGFDRKIAILSKASKNDINSFIEQDYNVFARAVPEQKKIIVETLKKRNNIVTMIGDGVNDLMALKIADCSISMPNGHDVVKKISNFVLLDSDFKNIIFLINESKRVMKNIQSMYSVFFVKIFTMIFLSFIYIFLSLRYNLFFPFRTNHLLPWEMLSSGLGPILISFDQILSHEQIEIKSFIINIFKKCIPAVFLQIAIYLSCFYTYFFFPNFLSYTGHICLSVILMSFNSFFILCFLCCQPLSKYRCMIMATVFSGMILMFGVDIYIFIKNGFSNLLDICYSELNIFSSIFLLMISTLLFCIYMFLTKRFSNFSNHNHKK